MKKLMFCLTLLAGMAIVACSKDDSSDSNCVTCTGSGSSQEICKGDNGNAYFGGTDSGVNFYTYIDNIEASGSSCN